MQATVTTAEGLVTAFERQAEAVRAKRVAAEAAAANLTADPNAFFARTVTALGGAGAVTASLTTRVVFSEKAPEPEPEFRDAFFGLPGWAGPWAPFCLNPNGIHLWITKPLRQ